jgi:hypothetical protein
MGYKSTNKIFMPFLSAAMDPVDATTYAVANFYTAMAATTDRVINVPYSGRITKVMLRVDVGTNGSNEDCAFSLRVDNTTDYSIKADVKMDDDYVHLIENLDIPVSAGSFFWIKVVTATWVTNPLQTRISGAALFECE